MNDFLSHLVDRALGSAPVLQRRRPSLFETPAHVAELRPAPTESLEREDFAEVQPTPMRVRKHRAEARNERPLPESLENAAEAPVVERDRPVEFTKPQPIIQPAPETQTFPAKVEHEASVREQPPRERTRELETIRVVEKVIEREVIERQPVIEARSNDAEEKPAPQILKVVQSPPEHHSVEPKIRRSKPEPEGSPVPKAKALALPVILPFPRPATRERAFSPASRPQPAPPTIQVTIGRLEIRASTPSAPPRRQPRPTEPKLSLEDYLRSRQ